MYNITQETFLVKRITSTLIVKVFTYTSRVTLGKLLYHMSELQNKFPTGEEHA